MLGAIGLTGLLLLLIRFLNLYVCLFLLYKNIDNREEYVHRLYC